MAKPTLPTGKGAITRVLAIVAVLAVVAALVLAALPGDEKKYVTASFPRAVSLYEGSDVRILGVPVGKVETVTPQGTDVQVKMWYDAKYDVPKDAEAIIISPAIVGDRFVQLSPVFEKGDVALGSSATLSTSRTSTPLELDEIYQSIDDLTVALGPQGANSNGALTNLLDSTAENFNGQGAKFNSTIKNLSKFTSTLDNNKEELFGTAREIERFVQALDENDTTVRQFNDSLAASADLLKDERDDLAAALKNLGVAMEAVSSYVKENRDALGKNIKGLNRVSKVLVKQRAALDEVLSAAPTALSNLFHTYNPSTGTLDTRTNFGANIRQLETDPGQFLCQALNAGTDSDNKELCDALQAALPRPGALDGAAASRASAREEPAPVENVDRSLAGIVEVKR